MMILVTNSVSVSFLKQSKEEYFEKQILGTDYSSTYSNRYVLDSDRTGREKIQNNINIKNIISVEDTIPDVQEAINAEQNIRISV